VRRDSALVAEPLKKIDSEAAIEKPPIIEKASNPDLVSIGTKSVPISGNEKCTTPQGEYWVKWLS
jgi:hypothetical protein